MYFMAAAKEAGTVIIGPNTAGTVTVDECFLGFMPAFNERVFRVGNVGVVAIGFLGDPDVSKYHGFRVWHQSVSRNWRDPIIGTTTRDALEALNNYKGVEAIAMVGEIGGTMEEAAAEYAATMSKPIVAFIAGGAAPPGKKMGHAGVIVTGDKAGTYASKKICLEGVGVNVLATPSHVGMPKGKSWLLDGRIMTSGQQPKEQNRRRGILTVSGFAHFVHDGFTDTIYVLLPLWASGFGLSHAQVGLLKACMSVGWPGCRCRPVI